jgi:anti-anti-sigma factor
LSEPAVSVIDVPIVDYLTSDAFAAALDDAVRKGGGSAIVDLSRVQKLHSLGLRALIAAAKSAAGYFAVAAPQPLVAEVLRIGRLDLVFPVFDTVDAARRAAPKG